MASLWLRRRPPRFPHVFSASDLGKPEGDWYTENILVFGYRGFGVSQKSHPKVAKKSEAMTLYISNWVTRMMHRDMAGASAITSSGKEIQILRVDAKQPSAVQSFGLRGEVMEAVYVNKCKLSSIFTSTAFSVWKNTDCMNKFIHIVLLSRYTWKILRNAASDSLTSILEASTFTKHRRQAHWADRPCKSHPGRDKKSSSRQIPLPRKLPENSKLQSWFLEKDTKKTSTKHIKQRISVSFR